MKISKTHHVTKKGTVKKNPASEWIVFNFMDGITASPEVYPTKAAADKFIEQFKMRFKAQGYYLNSRRERIPINKIDVRAIKAEDIGKALSKSNPWGF